MIRFSVAVVPLILAATPALAQTHAGHGATSPAPRQAPPTTQGCVAPGSTTATTGNAGMSQSPASACPPGTVPARAAGAAHDMSTMGQAQPAPATAGHDMSTMPMGAAPAGQADPHAGHDMSTMGQAQPAPATAGHDMSTMPMGAAPAGQADPHAGHDMSTMGQAQPAPATAGHDMSTMPMGAPPSGQGTLTRGTTCPAWPAWPCRRTFRQARTIRDARPRRRRRPARCMVLPMWRTRSSASRT
ncbi:Uncharacterised protein [Brevundimonas diminuta]|uniref:Copper resistance protein B n=1 Tax=Brevundimonas diminuta TaxID=293 RepID=A0A2X1CCP5_BREDI|nr:Uncharacterised protein [Brevundimonas diminuta]